MRRRLLLVVLAASMGAGSAGAMAVGCGDTIRVDPGEGGGGSDDGGVDGRADGNGGSSGHLDGGKDALPDYVDPGCPDAGPPIYDYQCDPYAQFNGDCAPGEGCYIYVEYPSEPCASEVYGSFCGPQGGGVQGDSCGGGFDCAGGFVCVVTGSGTQCVQLCPLTGDDGCPAGLVCETIDVEGFGGCL